jgi:hypothetical protein
MKISEIYEGWRNNLFPPERLAQLIETTSGTRMDICNSCEFHSKNHKSIRPDAHCTNCGCTLAAKTKCLSCECPLSKWKAILTQEQEKEIRDNEARRD